MSNICTIPRSNVLCFKDKTEPNLTNFDNRLLVDNYYPKHYTIVPYYQKFNTGDNIFVQFTTNYDTYEVLLIGYDETAEVTKDLTDDVEVAFDYLSGNLKIYNLFIETTELTTDKYYLKVTFSGAGKPTLTYYTEWFHVGDFSDLPLVSWTDAINDGVYYSGDASEVFAFRCEISTLKMNVATEADAFASFNSENYLLKSIKQRVIEAETDGVPYYISEKLALACGHKTFKVNGLTYTATEPNIRSIEGSSVTQFICKLTQNNYENYYDSTGVEYAPPIDNFGFIIETVEGLDDVIIINDAGEILKLY